MNKQKIVFFALLIVYLSISSINISQSIPQTNPKAASIARGAKLFDKATCSFCHPGGGNAVNPSRSLYGNSFIKRYPDDKSLVKVIRNGIKGTAMQAFAKDKISDSELADIIAYIRSLSCKK